MIILKSLREIDRIKRSNVIVVEILEELKKATKPGITTLELEDLTKELLIKKKAQPAFKGYRGYPACLCTSVNEEVVHGIPSNRVLKEGDILSIDFGVLYDGYYGDAAITIPVGKVSQEAKKLMDVAEKSLYEGIKMARVGNRLSDISHAIQVHVEKNNFSVVRDFVGHGIGRELHEAPQIPNYGYPGKGVRLKSGMVLAIEPMVNIGNWEINILSDGWTAVTRDNSLSAHFEHSVAITDTGAIILSTPS